MGEVGNPLLDDPWLVCDQVQLHVGRKEHFEALEDRVQLFAEFDDILPLLHLNGEEQARGAVVAHHEGRVLITTFHIGEIFDVGGMTILGNVHEHVPDFVFGIEDTRGPHGDF
jgi:hypothetical protein